jgi:hypothetical protein
MVLCAGWSPIAAFKSAWPGNPGEGGESAEIAFRFDMPPKSIAVQTKTQFKRMKPLIVALLVPHSFKGQ